MSLSIECLLKRARFAEFRVRRVWAKWEHPKASLSAVRSGLENTHLLD